MYPVGSSQNSDWSENISSFLTVVYENFFVIAKIQLEFSVPTMIQIKILIDYHNKANSTGCERGTSATQTEVI